MSKKIYAALGAALLLAAPLAAQHQHGAGHGQGHGTAQAGAHAHGAGHSGGHAGLAGRALMHRADLSLSAAQVTRLQAIEARLKQLCAEHGPHMRAEASSGGTTSQAHTAMMTEMRTAMARAATETRTVLTAAQSQKLDAAHAAHHGPAAGGNAHAGHHGAAAGGAHAAHGQGGAHAAHGQGGAQGKDCCDLGCCDDCGSGCCGEAKSEEHAGHHGTATSQR